MWCQFHSTTVTVQLSSIRPFYFRSSEAAHLSPVCHTDSVKRDAFEAALVWGHIVRKLVYAVDVIKMHRDRHEGKQEPVCMAGLVYDLQAFQTCFLLRLMKK